MKIMRNLIGIIILGTMLILMGCNGVSNGDVSKGNTTEMTEGAPEPESVPELESEDDGIEYREVIFQNMYQVQDFFYTDEYVTVNEVRGFYDSTDEDALYAFAVSCYYDIPRQDGESSAEYALRCAQERAEHTVKKALDMGLMVMQEHPYVRYQNDNLKDIIETHFYAGKGSKYNIYGDCVVVCTIDKIYELFGGTEQVEGELLGASAIPRPDLVDILEQIGFTEDDFEEYYYGMANATEKVESAVGKEYQIKMTVPVIVPEEK